MYSINTKLGIEPAQVPPMELVVDPTTFMWRVNTNKGPPRYQTPVKQAEVRKQIDKLLPAEVVRTSQAQHLVKKQ